MNVSPNMDALVRLNNLIDETSQRDLNEADTRHRIIDFLIHDFLSWPRNRVSVEEYIRPGFADYVLKKSNDDPILLIEAKKEGFFFEIPIAYSEGDVCSYIGLKKLLTDINVCNAISQVREYCINIGCEFACISNGHEWIFFTTFEKGKRWDDAQAFVVRGLGYFRDRYTSAINSLSYTAIVERASLLSLLASSPPKDRPIFFPKEKISSYAHQINANRLAAKLRPIANRYFGVISDNDTEFMDRCYVSQADYIATSEGMRSLMLDTLTPYFEEFGIQQLNNTGKGGQLGGRLTKHIKKEKKGEVLVLFGGKGSGKSTFLKRVLHHQPPRWLKEHSTIAIIDLLKISEDEKTIKKHIWMHLVTRLDSDGILSGERDDLTHQLFSDRFEIARRQDLAGLARNSEAYNVKLNALVAEWKSDLLYCASRLAIKLNNSGRGIIVAIDNTDQYSSSTQDFCFTLAQEISSRLDCVVLISMREERFFNSKIHGTLDAFQNAGFHISSPRPSDVFRRRLNYIADLLRDGAMGDNGDRLVSLEIAKYLRILSKDFAKDRSPLNKFLSASAHGDIRLSLDLFRSFVLSGYTNVDEMLSVGHWEFQIHQVVKPVMTPNRFFYDEALSDIPNIYQVRSVRHGSHFTGLRILRKLMKSGDPINPGYFAVTELRSYFIETFRMEEDFEKNVDVLLKHGLVEANNRVDFYSDGLDSLRITSYGAYVFNELAYDFTYIDLVSLDCGVFSEGMGNYLVEAARTEYKQFTSHQRAERVQARLDRVAAFIKYLSDEEEGERDFYSLGMPTDEMFSYKAQQLFDEQKTRVLRSLRRQNFGRKAGRECID